MKQINKINSFTNLIPLVFAFLIVSTLLTVFLTNEYMAKDKIENIVNELIHEKSQVIVNKLQNNLSYIESLTRSLAVLGQELDKNNEDYKRVVPALFNKNKLSNLIAGGGLWPAPYKFKKNKEKHSFFWGKDSNGQFKFHDEYNSTDGPGYHNEEWYIPAKYLKEGEVYWSKSYVDPYTKEPMVTCSTPYFKDDVFMGVATIDLKLNELNALFKDESKQVQGYMFVLDRNNKILTFPKNNLIDERKLLNEKNRFITITELTNYLPHLKSTAKKLERFNDNHIKIPNEFEKLVKTLDFESYDISRDDAKLIVKNIISKKSKSVKTLATGTISKDPILSLDTVALTFLVPETHWKIVIVAPSELIKSPANEIMNNNVFAFLIVMAVVFLLTFYIFNKKLLIPFKTIQLQLLSDNFQELNIPNSKDNELGLIADLFNKRTRQLKEEMKKAEQASRVKGQFLAAMSHEIRTPLNGIIGTLDVLNDSKLDDKQSELIKIIKISSSSLLAIINDILDFSKLQEFKVIIKDQPYKLNQLFEECISLYKGLLESKKLQYEFIMDNNCPNEVFLDPIRLKQIINNLVSNAIKFTEVGKVTVKLSAKSLGNNEFDVRVDVIDSGIGICSEDIPKLFKSFSQIESGNNRNFGGTGLGLVICKKLCELMGGDISVTSTVNKGSTFTFNFITKKASKFLFTKSKSELISSSNMYQEFNSNILVVEDNLINQKVISKILEKLNMDFQIANNGQIALDMIKENEYPLVLMDIQMPVMDGIECMQNIRNSYKKDDYFIVALTANALEEDKEKCMKAGADKFTTKPITTEKIKRIVNEFMTKKEKAS